MAFALTDPALKFFIAYPTRELFLQEVVRFNPLHQKPLFGVICFDCYSIEAKRFSWHYNGLTFVPYSLYLFYLDLCLCTCMSLRVQRIRLYVPWRLKNPQLPSWSRIFCGKSLSSKFLLFWLTYTTPRLNKVIFQRNRSKLLWFPSLSAALQCLLKVTKGQCRYLHL